MLKRAIAGLVFASLAFGAAACVNVNPTSGDDIVVMFASPILLPAMLVSCAFGSCGDAASRQVKSPLTTPSKLNEIRSEPTTWQRANEGNAAAQKEMGVRYQSGDWVVQDDEQADMWFTLAADGGNHEAAVLRDELEKRMTPEQIAEARKRAQEWKPTMTSGQISN